MPDLTTQSTNTARPESVARSRTPILLSVQSLLRTPIRNRLAVVFALWLAIALVYWPSSLALNAIWQTKYSDFQDGYVVLLLSLFLIVRDRKLLATTPLQPMSGALLMVVALSVTWLWAWRAAIQEAHVELVPLLLFCALVAVLGWRTARVVAFPVAYLYFAMPMWMHINGVLQHLSATMTGMLIWMAGLPAYMQGNLIELPWGQILIAGGCSGLNTFVVGLALGALYGKIVPAPPRRRLMWVAIMALLALIVNWVRIFIITVVAYGTHMRSPLVRHHIWFGWLLFALTFAGFLWWAERSRRDHDRTPHVAPLISHESPASIGHGTTGIATIILTVAALAVLPLVSYGLDWARASTDMPVQIVWPAAAPGWVGPQPARSRTWIPKFVNASGVSFAQYTDAGQPVQAYTVAYRSQTQSGKLLGYGNSLLGNPNRLRSVTRHDVAIHSGRWRETLTIDASGERSLIWSRFRIGNRFFVHPLLAQLWYGLQALVQPPLSSVTALRAICKRDCHAARARLARAAMWLQPTLREN